jgi:hypothetical protein
MEFEARVVDILTRDVLSPSVRESVKARGELVSLEHSGAGYFLTLRHESLPIERIVCDEPAVHGLSEGVATGFIVFLGDREMMLECHAWGPSDVPETYRGQSVEITAT